MHILCDDFRFASSTGALWVVGSNGSTYTMYDYSLYGYAQNATGRPNSYCNVDLRGTPFAVACEWSRVGWNNCGSAEISAEGQVVNASGGGYQGAIGPNYPKTTATPHPADDHSGYAPVKWSQAFSGMGYRFEMQLLPQLLAPKAGRGAVGDDYADEEQFDSHIVNS